MADTSRRASRTLAQLPLEGGLCGVWGVCSHLQAHQVLTCILCHLCRPAGDGSLGNSHLMGSSGPCCLPCPVCRQPCSIFWIWAGNPPISPSLWTFSYHISS